MEQTRITLRLDKELYEKVRKESADNMRSINKQIEFVLKKHFEGK